MIKLANIFWSYFLHHLMYIPNKQDNKKNPCVLYGNILTRIIQYTKSYTLYCMCISVLFHVKRLSMGSRFYLLLFRK